MNTIKRLWQNITSVQVSGNNNVVMQSNCVSGGDIVGGNKVTSRPPEYPIEVRKLIARLVALRDHEDTAVWATVRSLLRTWDHDRNNK